MNNVSLKVVRKLHEYNHLLPLTTLAIPYPEKRKTHYSISISVITSLN
jgi:hypothetical protein